jgi:hypothetical protein
MVTVAPEADAVTGELETLSAEASALARAEGVLLVF